MYWQRKAMVNTREAPCEMVLQLLLPPKMGNMRKPPWAIEASSFFVPSQYLLVHKSFAAFGNSLFCLNVEPASLLRHVLESEELYILHLRFTSSIKEIFNTYGCLGRDEIQVLKIFMDLTQNVYNLYAVTSRTSDLQPMFSSKSPTQLMTTAVDRL